MPNWPSIPPSLISFDTVTISRVSWSQDRVKGRVPSYSSEPQALECSITAASATDVNSHSREEMLVKFVVTFQDNPNLKLRDRLTWVETGKLLTVVGVAPVVSKGARTWNAYCEEHLTS